MTPKRLYLLSFVASLVVTGLLWAHSNRAFEHPLADLVEQKASLAVWFTFHPMNCQVTYEQIEQLNHAYEERGIEVIGVMIDPPAETHERERLIDIFGIRFPMTFDDGTWMETLQRSGYSGTSIVIARPGRVVAVGSLEIIDYINFLIS